MRVSEVGERRVEKAERNFHEGKAFVGKRVLKFFPHLTTTKKKVTRIAGGTFVRF